MFDSWYDPPDTGPDLQDEIEAYIDQQFETLGEDAEEEIERDPEGEAEIIIGAMCEMMHLLYRESDGNLWEEVAEFLQDQIPEPDPDRGYDSRFDRD